MNVLHIGHTVVSLNVPKIALIHGMGKKLAQMNGVKVFVFHSVTT